MTRALLLILLAGWCASNHASEFNESDCPPGSGLALQVLGSGGPIADDGRASSSYLVWIDGKARVLVDAGGGSFLRFGESGARFEDLELIALSHYHTDHSADLPALLKSGYFSPRKRSLPISGPAEGGPFPGLSDFLAGMLHPERGSYRYLSGYSNGTDGLVRLDQREIDQRGKTASVVRQRPGLRVSALGVPHGIVPAVAYRVEAGDRTIVFGSDQNGSNRRFAEFAGGADMLVAHMAIPENAGRSARSLHATPSVIGRMAHDAAVPKLLLSHFMARSLASLDENLGYVRREYGGSVLTARDLSCLRP